ncbi:hypothetical protein [Bufonid herpesvirus 1]|uniref:hypothetical protein n=1 Tax=Bufonid herpesvirus 1 TaxID=2282206 RepID=UPI000EB747D0|nr:hypothetical protein [Bufonid herpesvirus 1]AXF48628.1 hypothetical protein [Bufonid herpesvirus 1]
MKIRVCERAYRNHFFQQMVYDTCILYLLLVYTFVSVCNRVYIEYTYCKQFHCDALKLAMYYTGSHNIFCPTNSEKNLLYKYAHRPFCLMPLV